MRRLLILALPVVVSATGCSHAMRITNLHEYQPAPTALLHPPRTVGLVSASSADPATRGFVDAIAAGLRADPSFQRVLYPFDERMQQEADVVLDVAVTPRYSGRGSNFFVNFPGFLIFAPAIWGYGYEADLDTRVRVRTREGTLREIAIPTRYRFRQAEIDRTWTELGWFEIGIIPLIGGIAFTQYDPDVTPEFVRRVAPSYGTYVAQRVRESLVSPEPALAPAPAPPAEQAPAPVPTS